MSATAEFDVVDDGSVHDRQHRDSGADDDLRDYRTRNRLSREEKRAEFAELVRTGRVVVREPTAEECIRWNIDIEQARRRREEAARTAEAAAKAAREAALREIARQAAESADEADLERVRERLTASRELPRLELVAVMHEAWLAGLTQREVADLVGRNRRMVSKWLCEFREVSS